MKNECPKRVAARGAVWVFLIGCIGFPLLYVRNWFLGQIRPDGEVAGIFALIVLLQGGISTFLFFGGKNVLTTFYPKLKSDTQRNGFINGFYLFVTAGTLLGILALVFWPECVEWLIRRQLDEWTRGILILLIPMVLLAYLGDSVVTAMQHFGLAAFLERLQLFVVTGLACLFYFFAPDLLAEKPLLIIGGTVLVVCFFRAFVTLAKVHKRAGFSRALWMPGKCVSFAFFSYLEKMGTFGYLAIDQIFVVQRFDVAHLGVYFLLLQVSRVVPLSVQFLAQIILTTFSTLLGRGQEQDVVSAYRKLSRLCVWLNFMLSLVLILFARPIAGLFGPICAQNYRYLVWLAVNMNLWSLYPTTSMCSTAYEKMRQVFYCKLSHIAAQLVVTLALIGSLGIYGVIIGKGVGILVGSIGLFIVLALCRPHDRIYPPAAFFVSQVFIISVAVYAHCFTANILNSILLLLLAAAGFNLAGRYRCGEFMAVVNLIRSKRSEK